MKKDYFRKLKFNVLLYFLLFTAIIIGSLWFFQIFFLENYYQSEKMKSLNNFGNMLCSEPRTSAEFDSSVAQCTESGIRVFVATKITVGESDDGSKKFDFVSILDMSRNAVINDKSPEYDFVNKAIDNYCNGIKSGIITDDNKTANAFFFCSKSEANSDDTIILTCSREKITEAITVIRRQFLIVTIIVVAVAVFLAFYFSVRLSKPIDEMSDSAKKWAQGDANVNFRPFKGAYTEINELGEALNFAKDEISKSGMLQRDLLANVSHDLKTPLTMIRAYAEMIRDISGDNKEKREKHTQVIIDESDRLSMLVNDILNLSKLQSAVDEPEVSEINLSELTERVIGRFSDYVEKEGYTIEDHIAPDLITVVDEKKIEQVIYNLLGNSINYTGEDKTVKVYLTAENDYILLEIIDSGKGISQEKIDTIWERYYRFSETNTRPVKGTGLGLSIVKAILDSHKLQYGVRSKKDCGSNFFVKFKRVKNNG